MRPNKYIRNYQILKQKAKEVTTVMDQTLYSFLKARLEAGDDSQLRFGRRTGETITIADIAIIQCHWGTDASQVAATRSAVTQMLDSDLQPAEWIFVEAQPAGTDTQFADLADLGASFIRRDIPDGSESLFLKEALWNVGALAAKSSRLVFLDSDIVFVSRDWLSPVSAALKAYDLISPHGWSYYADQLALKSGHPVGLTESCGHNWMRSRKTSGHPGFGLGMTRELFDRIGGIPVVSTCGGDTWFWSMVFGKRRDLPTQWVPYNVPYLWDLGLQPQPRIGATDEICYHVPHGTTRNARLYCGQAVLGHCCTTVPQEDIDYALGELPTWARNIAGGLHRTTRKQLLARKDEDIDQFRLARDIYDAAAQDEYGPIDDANPLTVAVAYRPGGSYTHRHVQLLKRLLERHLKTPHRFLCVSDEPIDGVETTPFRSTAAQTPAYYSQLELFRSDLYTPGTSVLTMDLDILPFRDFALHRAPLGGIALGMEFHNWPQCVRTLWNGGMAYFRDDFGFVLDDFLSETDIGGRHDPKFRFFSSQEFLTGALHAHGHTIQDILAHVPFDFFQGEGRRAPSADKALCHFLAWPKPWGLKEKPAWIDAADWRLIQEVKR